MEITRILTTLMDSSPAVMARPTIGTAQITWFLTKKKISATGPKTSTPSEADAIGREKGNDWPHPNQI